jgi:hypothetical protein
MKNKSFRNFKISTIHYTYVYGFGFNFFKILPYISTRIFSLLRENPCTTVLLLTPRRRSRSPALAHGARAGRYSSGLLAYSAPPASAPTLYYSRCSPQRRFSRMLVHRLDDIGNRNVRFYGIDENL